MTEKKVSLKNLIWIIFVGFGVILGIVISIFTLEDRVDKIVENKLKDPEVLKQIAYLVRPSLTFNQEGTILTDSGAQDFIKDIKVIMGENEPKSIIISPTNHLNIAPLIECLNYNYNFSSKQVGKLDWQFDLSSPTYLVTTSYQITDWTFRLEIIR